MAINAKMRTKQTGHRKGDPECPAVDAASPQANEVPMTDPILSAGPATCQAKKPRKRKALYRVGIASYRQMRTLTIAELSDCGRFAIHESDIGGDRFSLTHVPTGHAVAQFLSRRKAVALMAAFQAITAPAWRWRHPAKCAAMVCKEGRELRRKFGLSSIETSPEWTDSQCKEWVRTFVAPELVSPANGGR